MLRKKTIKRALGCIKYLHENDVIACESQRELYGFLGYFRWMDFDWRTAEISEILNSYMFKKYSKYFSDNYTPVIEYLLEKGLIYTRQNGNRIEYHITKGDVTAKIKKIKDSLEVSQNAPKFCHDFKVGDAVIVTRAERDPYEKNIKKGWENEWTVEMDETIGEYGIIQAISKHGILLYCECIKDSWCYPSWVLEKIKAEPQTVPTEDEDEDMEEIEEREWRVSMSPEQYETLCSHKMRCTELEEELAAYKKYFVDVLKISTLMNS
jgi:hypothetical protein